MKRVVMAIFIAALASLFLWSCIGCDNPVESDIIDNPTEPDDPADPDDPVDPGEVITGSYAENLWGEWIRIDNGDTWYISGKKISITGSAGVVPSNPTLTKQSDQVALVTESGKAPYNLFSSRRANATLRGKVILMDDTAVNNLSSPVYRATSLGGIEVDISNPRQPEKPAERAVIGSGGDFASPGHIGGDELKVSFPGSDMPDITLPPTSIPTDDTYQPPVTPIPVVTQGVNFKASIRPADTNMDTTTLYASGTKMNFLLEIENVGNLECTAATYSIEYAGSDLILEDLDHDLILGTLDPSGGRRPKATRRYAIAARPLTGTLAYRDFEIGVKITDGRTRKTWNDSVAIRYNRAKIPFRIGSTSPVQGIVKVPGGRTHYFKTESMSDGIYQYTLDLPWSTQDYFVIFSGATTVSQTRYSLSINTRFATREEILALQDSMAYEGSAGNDVEERAYRIENRDSIIAYLHGGANPDIDYYRINLGNEVPPVKLVPLETYAFTDTNGNSDGAISPGESAYLDIMVKNETEQSRSVTVSASATGPNADYITIDRGSATTSSIPSQYYATLTAYSASSVKDNVGLLVNSNLGSALKFSVSESCPLDSSIPILLSFSDSQDMTWTDTVTLPVVRGDRSMVIDTYVLTEEYNNGYGNGDNDVNPGETFTYAITVQNTGEAAVSGLQGTLTTTDSNVTLNTPFVSLGTIEPGASGTANFRFTVNTSCPPGTSIPFALTLRSSTGTTWEPKPPDLTVKARIPQNVQAAADSMNSVKLSWNAVSHTVDGYRVYYASSELGAYTLAGSSAGEASFTHTGLAAGAPYYYQVSAFGEGWESGRSGTASAKTWMDMTFNKAVNGTVTGSMPNYYRFYVQYGISYTFSSTMPAQVMNPNNGSSWLTLSDYDSPKSQQAYADGWALIKFDGPGSYSFKITSGEGAVSSFGFNDTTPASFGTTYEASKTIFVLVPPGTNIATLTPVVTSASDWTCNTTGAQNFNNPVEYRFTNSAGQAQVYTVTVEVMKDLVFNKAVSGTAAEGKPDYYLFHVTSGVNYAFASNKTAKFMRQSDGSSWFNLSNGSQSQSADYTGWAIAQLEETGAYTLTVSSGEAAVSGFVFNTTSPPSTGTINEAAKTISVLVPYDTNLSSLTPTVTPASGWTSATTGAQNFSGPAEYRFAKDGVGQAQVYAVTVTRKGQGGITIDPPGGDISIAGFPAADFTVSRNGSPTSYAIQINDTSYTSYEWYVDDMQKTADSGSGGRNFTIRAADYPIGPHTVTLIVYKTGVPYSNERRFTVTN